LVGGGRGTEYFEESMSGLDGEVGYKCGAEVWQK
jgi:hypothetical protein